MRGPREIQSTIREWRPERARQLRRLLRQAREGAGRRGWRPGRGREAVRSGGARAGRFPGEGTMGVSSGPQGEAGTEGSGLQLRRGSLDSPRVSGV